MSTRLPSVEEILCTSLGFAAACGLNFAAKRPVYSGFHRHIITTGLGYGVGWSLHKWFETQSKRRALHVQDYINAHPEHFPELFMPEKKWKDVFESWYPSR